MVELLQYAAFTTDPVGGNPAGVVLGGDALSDAEMQSIAADLGYSETAFFSRRGQREFDVRYFSPLIEVPFCGHATIAAAMAFAERHGTGVLVLHTRAGTVAVLTTERDATLEATLTTVRRSRLDDGRSGVARVDDGLSCTQPVSSGWRGRRPGHRRRGGSVRGLPSGGAPGGSHRLFWTAASGYDPHHAQL
jgi:predicted PhzF superfamily epimerase YddE/YHI9